MSQHTVAGSQVHRGARPGNVISRLVQRKVLVNHKTALLIICLTTPVVRSVVRLTASRSC